MIDKATRIYVAGHRGMVGSAIVRQLGALGYEDIVSSSSSELDLRQQKDVQDFFEGESIDQVYLAAAKVGGILANSTFPAEFLYDNLMIESNVINAAFSTGVKKLLFLGSSCIYPKSVEQPMREEALLTGTLEPTNEPYAIAKIAGIKLCESYNRQFGESHGVDYRSVMPTNLYGPGDNYHSQHSHVIPALIHRFHQAMDSNSSTVVVWGTGKPMREFLYVEDMAAACVYVMALGKDAYRQHTKPMLSHINIGCGSEISIAELAGLIAKTIGFKGQIEFDSSKPDGTSRKLMDSTRINNLGWQSVVSLEEGLKLTYQAYLETEVTEC